MRQKVMEAVVFPVDRELTKLRKENAIMKTALMRIAGMDYIPERGLELITVQSCVAIAEEAIDEIEGD